MCKKYFTSLPSSMRTLTIISAILCLVATALSVVMSFIKFYMPRHFCCKQILHFHKHLTFYDYKYIVPLMLALIAVCVVGWYGLLRYNYIIMGVYSLLMFVLFILLTMFTFYYYLWDDDHDFRVKIARPHIATWDSWKTIQVDNKGFFYGVGYAELDHIQIYYECCGKVSYEDSYWSFQQGINSTDLRAPKTCCAGGKITGRYGAYGNCIERFIFHEGCIDKVDDAYMEIFIATRCVYLANSFLMYNASLWPLLYFLIFFCKRRQRILVPIVVVEKITPGPSTELPESSDVEPPPPPPPEEKKGWFW